MSTNKLTTNEEKLLEIINNHPNKEFALKTAIEVIVNFLESNNL